MQCITSDSLSDVYYTDFQHSHLGYFNIPVHNTTQPSHLSSSSCAGVTVAAAAEKLAKDERHL